MPIPNRLVVVSFKGSGAEQSTKKKLKNCFSFEITYFRMFKVYLSTVVQQDWNGRCVFSIVLAAFSSNVEIHNSRSLSKSALDLNRLHVLMSSLWLITSAIFISTFQTWTDPNSSSEFVRLIALAMIISKLALTIAEVAAVSISSW